MSRWFTLQSGNDVNRRALEKATRSTVEGGSGTPVDRMRLRKSVPVLILVTVGFFASAWMGLSIPMLALALSVAILHPQEAPRLRTICRNGTALIVERMPAVIPVCTSIFRWQGYRPSS